MKVLETDRLILRRLATHDAAFMLESLNDPSFLHFIGDKGVRSLDEARRYILEGPMASYEQHGFGLYLTLLKEDETPIGTCGILKRDFLPNADLGFAFLPKFWRRGYASESTSAVMDYARGALGLQRILAITSPDNVGSAAVLGKVGFRFEKMMRWPGADSEVKLFVSEPND